MVLVVSIDEMWAIELARRRAPAPKKKLLVAAAAAASGEMEADEDEERVAREARQRWYQAGAAYWSVRFDAQLSSHFFS